MSLRGECSSRKINQKLKHELIRGKVFIDIEEDRLEVFWYIEIFNNKRRRHQHLGCLSSVEYDKKNEIVA